MPSLVIHLLIPPLVLLASRRVEPKLALLLLPFSLLPDIDFFVPPHRALLHSVFLMSAIAALSYHWYQRAERRKGEMAAIAAFYLFSHSFMDLFAGGVTPFFPLSDQTFFLDVEVLVDTATLTFFPQVTPGTQQGVPQVTPLYEFLNGDQAAIFALTMVVVAFVVLRRARRVEQEVVIVSDDSSSRGTSPPRSRPPPPS